MEGLDLSTNHDRIIRSFLVGVANNNKHYDRTNCAKCAEQGAQIAQILEKMHRCYCKKSSPLDFTARVNKSNFVENVHIESRHSLTLLAQTRLVVAF